MVIFRKNMFLLKEPFTRKRATTKVTFILQASYMLKFKIYFEVFEASDF